MLKAVIFDMDGVIVDSEPIFYEVEMNLFKDLGLNISEEEHRGYVGTKTSEMWTELKERFGIQKTVHELIDIETKRYLEYIASMKKFEPIPGVANLIKELSSNGISLALASSSRIEEISLILKMLKLKDYFGVVVSGDQVTKGKPAPDIFLLAIKKLKVLPEECIVFEDSENGVKAANSAGIKCIGFKGLNSRNQNLSSADIVINSFENINYDRLKQLCDKN